MVDDGDRGGGLRFETVGQVAVARASNPGRVSGHADRDRKLPVNAAKSAGEVKTDVWAAELLVSVAKTLPLVPASLALPSNGEALKLSVTDGIVKGIAPLGTLIDRLALVVPSIVVLEEPRFSAANWVLNEPDVTTSTSVSVPIVESKYKNA